MTPSFDTLQNLTEALGLSVGDLLERAGYSDGEYKSRKFAPYHEDPRRATSKIVEAYIDAHVIQGSIESGEPFTDERLMNVLCGIGAAAAMPALLRHLSDEQAERPPQPATDFLLSLLHHNPRHTLKILIAWYKHRVGEDGNSKAVWLEEADNLYTILALFASANPTNAKIMLEEGLGWGVAGLFVIPIAYTSIFENKAPSLLIERELSRWADTAEDQEVRQVVELTRSFMNEFRTDDTGD